MHSQPIHVGCGTFRHSWREFTSQCFVLGTIFFLEYVFHKPFSHLPVGEKSIRLYNGIACEEPLYEK